MAEIAIPESLTFTEIRVLALVNNPESVVGDVNLYASMAPNKPTSKDFQYQSDPVWNEGQGIILSRDQFQ